MTDKDKALEIHLRLLAEQAENARSPENLADAIAEMAKHLDPETVRKFLRGGPSRSLFCHLTADGNQAPGAGT